ncbi:MAG: DPP IV N-terminal domain-containing protein [Saprospiraceae bacterium]
MNGYNSLYHYDMNGRLIRQLTDSRYDVTAFYGVDEKNGKLLLPKCGACPYRKTRI